jgi:tetratricopeptide (TPR) repeat protein
MGDKRRIASALQPLGWAHLGQGHRATARRCLEEALAAAREFGEPREIAAATNALAMVHRMEGDLGAAEPLYEKVLELARQLDDRESIAIALLNLAIVAIGGRAEERAREMLLAVLAIVDEIGSKYVGQSLLEVSVGLAVLRREWQRAARFYGAAEAVASATGVQRDPADQAFLSPLVTKVESSLGAAGFAAAEQGGRRDPYEAVIAELRGWLTEPRRL